MKTAHSTLVVPRTLLLLAGLCLGSRVSAAAGVSESEFVLVGFVEDDTGASLAVIGNTLTHEEHFYGIGDPIDGGTVEEIRANSVVVKVHGEEMKLRVAVPPPSIKFMPLRPIMPSSPPRTGSDP